MSLTGLAFLPLYVGALILAFRRPVYGLCAYVWTFYASPSTSWWGQDLPDLRWSITAAVITLIASLLVGTQGDEPSESKSSEGPRQGSLATLVPGLWG